MLLNTKHNLVKCIIISFSIIEKKINKRRLYLVKWKLLYFTHNMYLKNSLDCYFVCMDSVVEDTTRVCIHTYICTHVLYDIGSSEYVIVLTYEI